MKKDFKNPKWKAFTPVPVCEDFSEFNELYDVAWKLAREHVKEIKGMPQTPYMDEAFCETQIWIWDTCFMSLFCKFANAAFPGVETLNNFYAPLYDGISLPEIIPSDKEPAWTGAKSGQPIRVKIHIYDNPPLFAWAEYENALFSGDKEHLKELLYERKYLQKHYEWMENIKAPVSRDDVTCATWLIKDDYGYKWEGGRSGMDNTPRGRLSAPTEVPRPNNPDMLWIDAICQQALAAKSISDMFKIWGDEAQSNLWLEKYNEKKKIVNENYYDDKDGFYYDIDCNDHHFYKVATMGSYWALTSGIADEARAKKMASYLFNDDMFGGKVPFTSLARNDADFVDNGKYWRGSVWLPTAYAALKGLAKYGLYEEARQAAVKLLTHMLRTYQTYSPHTIWECYSPTQYMPGKEVDGVTSARPDFCGWSALGPIAVYLEFVLGFHTVNAFEKVVEWAKPNDFKGEVGVKNLRFGDIVTDITAKGNQCKVKSNGEYTLKVNGCAFSVVKGDNAFEL